MIWLSWRQFRTQAAVAFGLLAMVAVLLAITGPQLVHLYDTSVVPAGPTGLRVATSTFPATDRCCRTWARSWSWCPG